MTTSSQRGGFTAFAHKASTAAGSPFAFIAACAIIIGWVFSGPIFKYSDTWQLVINTGTTIITFLMVFLIQNTQNRDSKVLHLKLDELLRAVSEAQTDLIDMDEMSEAELEKLHQHYSQLAKESHETLSEKREKAI